MKTDQGDSDWRWRKNVTPHAIGCTLGAYFIAVFFLHCTPQQNTVRIAYHDKVCTQCTHAPAGPMSGNQCTISKRMSHVVFNTLFAQSVVRCSVLQCVAVCCSVLRCVAVCCSVLQCVAVCCSVLLCVAVRCNDLRSLLSGSEHFEIRPVCCIVLQYVAVRYSALHCVAVCCRVLPCVVVCCSVLPCVAVCCRVLVCCSVLRKTHDVSCVAVCCRVLQCVSLLQCVAECCSVLRKTHDVLRSVLQMCCRCIQSALTVNWHTHCGH